VHRSRGDVRLAFEALRRMLEFNPVPAYLCRDCGRREPEWVSRCPGCGTWDSLDALDACEASAEAAPRASARPGR
ncbi:MAG: hypothetical protein ACREQY_20895, partial [Candidatus Binatia bacterium]